MKKIAISILFLFVLLNAHGQYESFFGRESWEYNIVYRMTCKDYNPNALGACCRTFSFVYHRDDTVRIGEKTYYKTNSYDVFLREDTVTGRLYGRYSTVETDDEYVLCDLSLSVGDTMVIPGGVLTVYGDKPMVVDSITCVFGKKVIHLKALQEDDDYFFGAFNAPWMMEGYNISLRFMEGVGPIFGIVPTFEFSFENDLGLLLCMHKDDTLCHMTHETLGCNQYGADIPEHSQSFLQVFPNPTSGNITIAFSKGKVISGHVTVRDMVGQICKQLSVTDKNITIDVSSLPQGVYMLTFTDEKNNINTKKFIKR